MEHPRTISAAREAVATGKLKPSELVGECLRRCRQWEKRIHAWVELDIERATAEAHRLDGLGPERLAQLPLAGIPLGIKDVFDAAGLPTRYGSKLTSEAPVGHDATAVARLRAAGAIILGKTVTTEFAAIDPPPTRNPWNLEHTPGGSSSGSAAGVALGMCLGAIGTQTAGSVIRPASYCGVAGLKPTFGRVDRAGALTSSPSLDHIGALAGSVADLQILWQVLADAHPHQPAHHSSGHSEHAEHHHALWHLARHHKAEGDPGFPERMPRLGIVRGLLSEASPEVLLVTEVTLGWLESHGVELIVANVPGDLDEIQAMHRTIMTFEMAKYHRANFAEKRGQFGPLLAGFIEEGLAIDETRYQAARKHQTNFQSQLATAITGVDAWVLPSSKTTAPARLDTTGDARCNIPWSYGGVPAITLPCGVAKDDMPVGLQLVGPHHGDESLLAVAAWCEEHLAFSEGPRMLAELD
jgi:Asp-tRNA(Asn)/Glu-tRNA(Gln) amidotransferase A subunit family amidase